MRAKLGWSLVWGALVVVCFVGHFRNAAAGNCALYARAVTGVDLYGAAGGWWYQAAGRYPRGQMPAVGSILVFRATGAIPSGHVAVVSKVVGPTMVLVDQSNWYHGRVTVDTPVIDTSPNHDWTTVAVQNLDTGQFGRDNPTFGFVYPQSVSTQAVVTIAAGGFDAAVAASRAADDPTQQAGLFHFAIGGEDRYPTTRSRRLGHRRTARHSVRIAIGSHWHSHSRSRFHSVVARTVHAPQHTRARNAQTRRDDRVYRTASAG